MLHTNDWPTIDPSGLHNRPEFFGLVPTDDCGFLQVHATGIQDWTSEVADIINGKSDDASVPYGAIYSSKISRTQRESYGKSYHL